MVLIDVVDPAQRQQRRTDLRTIPLKTQCNNHPISLPQNGSQLSVLLHGDVTPFAAPVLMRADG